MRRTLSILATTVLLASLATMASARATVRVRPRAGRAENYGSRLVCGEGSPLCAEANDALGYKGGYTGHDEPSLLFYSDAPGSGNESNYRMIVPTDPPTLPEQDGTGGTFNFQDRIAFWFGMDLCDNQSAPEFTHAACVPNSDTNIFDSGDPTAVDYIGRHPGTAFLELQFYPPGWVPFQEAISCDATQWCAAMAIFSFNRDQNRGIDNNAACLNSVGIEPANFAFITKSGEPDSPPAPLDLTGASFEPDPTTDLFMDAGDELAISIHDSPDGLVTQIDDRTSGESGSMTASVDNGFAQVNFEPNAATCTQAPYAFHPMYSTSSEHTRVPWAAHSYNVAFSDEIGHFEYCDRANVHGKCVNPGVGEDKKDGDDVACFNADESLLVEIGGCIATDNDFDGVSYQPNWPGTGATPALDAALNPTSILFTSPTFGGGQNFDRVGFEADLPRIEAADFGGICDRSTGTGCVNPPAGSNFYPFYSTRNDGAVGCFWQLGGANIPGTTNTFGGNSAAEFGPLLFLDYPGPVFTPIHRTNDFRQVLDDNPCLNEST
ncbi:MAG TPA: hypothetical protein VI411_00015 [Actinomycetota bacterium]